MAQARLHKLYNDKIKADLTKQFGYKNPMQVPSLKKISINMGLGEAINDSKVIDFALNDLTQIAGQKAVSTKAKKSIATFKLRQGYPIGARVTLRRKRMFDFIDRLIEIALPKVRDFRGLNFKSFDGKGNITFGIKEQTIFPEIRFDKVDKIRGMNITFVTDAKTPEEAAALLKGFNIPFYNLKTKEQ